MHLSFCLPVCRLCTSSQATRVETADGGDGGTVKGRASKERKSRRERGVAEQVVAGTITAEGEARSWSGISLLLRGAAPQAVELGCTLGHRWRRRGRWDSSPCSFAGCGYAGSDSCVGRRCSVAAKTVGRWLTVHTGESTAVKSRVNGWGDNLILTQNPILTQLSLILP